MAVNGIPFKETGFFSSLICDYLNQDTALKPFYNRYPHLENFKLQIQEKQHAIQNNALHRKTLVTVLQEQYKGVDISAETLLHIEQLKQNTTFTVTTGHQLNLFTGPLYFFYKIITTINLAKTLKSAYPDYNFVPVYWMATEDHDFDEINYFNFNGKKIQWTKASQGAVGHLSTAGLDAVYALLSKELGNTNNAKALKALFKKAYLEHDNLAKATQYIVNKLFKDYGLVVLDANNKALKKLFIPFFKEELLTQATFKAVTATNEKISSLKNNAYKIQVTPRKINLFYLTESIRERIVFEQGVYKVLNTKISFSKTEILKELETYPERFSPNVIMRPLYQEVVLPNLCYIGGGGELAYWLQLKSSFNALKVTFPMLLLRNSVLITSNKQDEKLKKLNISASDIFLKRNILINKKVREISDIDIDFSDQKQLLKQQFSQLYELAKQTDRSFLGAVKAQEKKQIKGLENLEKRLLKAQKKKLQDHVFRITELQNELFPNQGLQERNTNFSQFYLEYGNQLILTLLNKLNPLQHEFVILNL